MNLKMTCCALVIALVSGCNSGLSDDTLVSTVTDAEAMALCEELLPVANRSVPTITEICTLGVFSAAMGDSAMCETLRDACIAMPPPVRSVDCTTAMASDFGDPTCATVTVGELIACFEAFADQNTAIFARADCSNAGTPAEPSVGELSAVPPVCMPLMACL